MNTYAVRPLSLNCTLNGNTLSPGSTSVMDMLTYFRPPMGEFSARMLANIQDFGYTSVFWSYAYRDWEPDAGVDPAEACRKAVEALHPGAIYLLHAVSPYNAEMLPGFIDQARAAGYTFVPLP